MGVLNDLKNLRDAEDFFRYFGLIKILTHIHIFGFLRARISVSLRYLSHLFLAKVIVASSLLNLFLTPRIFL